MQPKERLAHITWSGERDKTEQVQLILEAERWNSLSRLRGELSRSEGNEEVSERQLEPMRHKRQDFVLKKMEEGFYFTDIAAVRDYN